MIFQSCTYRLKKVLGLRNCGGKLFFAFILVHIFFARVANDSVNGIFYQFSHICGSSMILGADFFRDPSSNRNKNVTIAAATTFFLDFGATFFFLFLPKSRESPWEFLEIFGIPRNSQEFPEILGNPPIFKKN